MKNEPVAWMVTSKVICLEPIEGAIPLYKHPAKTKDEPNWKEMYLEMHELNHKHWSKLKAHPVITPLTEDECEAIINRHDWFSKSWKEMAKEIHDAILRKAQEKC